VEITIFGDAAAYVTMQLNGDSSSGDN